LLPAALADEDHGSFCTAGTALKKQSALLGSFANVARWVPGLASECRHAGLARLGAALFLVSCIGFGIVELAFGKPLPELHPWIAATRLNVELSGVTLVVGGIAAWVRPWRRVAALGLAGHWLIAFVSCSAVLVASPSDPIRWVPLAKSAVFALSALTIGGTVDQKHLNIELNMLRVALGLALAFFGAVHLVDHRLITGLIPHWVPVRPVWPFFTGALMAIAGCGMVANRGTMILGLAVAAQFASWVVLVHSARIVANPASAFEWTFALGAAALTGAALIASSTNLSCLRA
jgi:uncharacterized membrane protein